MSNNRYPDRFYYNIGIANNELINKPTYALFKNVLNQPLLYNPSLYYMVVLRFQIPTMDIPILIPEIEAWPNTNVNKTIYTVTLQYNVGLVTHSATADVIYTPANLLVQPREITATNPNPMVDPSSYYFIYNYRQFINMVNTAFALAYTNLNTSVGGILASSPPYFTYNGQTLLMTLHCPDAYLSSLANPINIFMNDKLYSFFDGIEYIFTDYLSDTGIQIQVIDYNGSNHSGTEYEMSQQYVTLSDWNTFKSIQVVSSFLPIENEIMPTASYQTQNIYNSVPIVKDFVPIYQNGPDFRSFINFSASGQYELINLNSNVPISTIDISIYWVDRYGNRYLLTIPYNQILTMKFAFIKKDTYVG